jgi:hypothetical protein
VHASTNTPSRKFGHVIHKKTMGELLHNTSTIDIHIGMYMKIDTHKANFTKQVGNQAI